MFSCSHVEHGVYYNVQIEKDHNGIPCVGQYVARASFGDVKPWYGDTYKEAHRIMWHWLADNPSKEKHAWPGWDVNGGPWKSDRWFCFACLTGMNTQRGCPKCPLDWGVKWDNSYLARCEHPGTLYYCWRPAHTSSIAREIAEMPWTDHKKKKEPEMKREMTIPEYAALPYISAETAQVGSEVWTEMYGLGRIRGMDYSSHFPVRVSFCKSDYESYTFDGREYADRNQVLHLVTPAPKGKVTRTVTKWANYYKDEDRIGSYYDSKEMADAAGGPMRTACSSFTFTWEEEE